MNQYRHIVSYTRIPGRELDKVKVFHHKSRHIAVFCNGRVFKVPLSAKALHDCLLSRHEIQLQLASIEAMIKGLNASSVAEENLPALTASSRIEWAVNRNRFISEGINMWSLEAIETSVLVVVLQVDEPADWTLMAKVDPASGGNRWSDRSFYLGMFESCVAGINAELAWAGASDGQHVYTAQPYKNPSDAKGGAITQAEGEKSSPLPPCKLLAWDFSSDLDLAVTRAVVDA